jgi:hypothetical protein
MIVMKRVLETTIAPQLNNILQNSQRCEVAVGVGQRATDQKIVVQPPCAQIKLCYISISSRLVQHVFAQNNNAGCTGK